MRLLKILYYIALFSFFALSWWHIVPREYLLWMLLSAIAVIVLLHVISYKKYGKVVSLDTKADSAIIVVGMLVMVVIRYTVFND